VLLSVFIELDLQPDEMDENVDITIFTFKSNIYYASESIRCNGSKQLMMIARVTLQLDPMPLARLSRGALLLGYRDDLLLSLLVAELDTNNSFLSGRTREDFD